MISRPLVKGVKGLVKGLVKGFKLEILAESTMVKGVKGSRPDKPVCVRAGGRARKRAGARTRTCAHGSPQPFTPFTPLTKGGKAMKGWGNSGEGFGEGCEGGRE